MDSAMLESPAISRVKFRLAGGQVAGSKLDGIVGYNFLRHDKVVIDYPNETFRLQ